MVFTGYLRNDGAFVLVPDCLVASRDAHARHGPLRFAGHFESNSQPDPVLWERVMADVDRQSYAVVRKETGRGLDCLERMQRSA